MLQRSLYNILKKITTCCWEDEVGVVDPKFPVLLFCWIFMFELGLILRVEFWAGELPVPLIIKTKTNY